MQIIHLCSLLEAEAERILWEGKKKKIQESSETLKVSV